MTKYIIRRVIQAIPVLFLITLVVYGILLAAPGGPVDRFANNPRVTNEQRVAFIKRWGLDQPIPIQYGRWMGILNPDRGGLAAFLSDSNVPNFLPAAIGGGDNGVLHADFGVSIDSGTAVADRVGASMLPTFLLAGSALIIWVTVAVLIGTLAAIKRYSLFDQAVTVFSYVGYAMPTFWLGIMLIYIFSGPGLNILPAGGITNARISPPFGTSEYWTWFGANTWTGITEMVKHLILPVFTLVVVSIAGDSRFVRGSMLEALSQDYVRTARAKGLANRAVVFKHAFRNAMLPVVTNIGLELPFLFSGAIVTETIFSWPGIGKLTIDSTNHFDYPMLMAILLITASLTVMANLLADIAYAIVDPRIKY